MRCKDCKNAGCRSARPGGTGSVRSPIFHRALCALVGVVFISIGQTAWAGNESARVWPSAVVVGDSIHLDEVCELRGLDAQTEQRLAKLVVAESPPAGGSRIIHLELIRSVLSAAGANLAQLRISGATQCAVSKPSQPPPSASGAAVGTASSAITQNVAAKPSAAVQGKTLQQAVVEYFNTEFARYGGTAEVVFDRTSNQVLELSGPAYEFRVRRRGGSGLGLCPLEIEISTQGRLVQSVPMVVQVTLNRRVVTARRTINQGAAIGAADVELTSLSFNRVDELGLDDVGLAIGQRGRRVITAGSLVEADMLEAVPLVLRGQLVTLTSMAGAVRVVTTAKAAADGQRGDVIKVRALDDKKVEFDAVVVGPGEVQVGSEKAAERQPQLAQGGRR